MSKKKAPNPVTIAAFTLATILLWTIMGVVRLLGDPVEVEIPRETLQALSPNLNQEALEGLSSRTFFTNAQIGNVILALPEVEEENEEPEETGESETATESATLETEGEDPTESTGSGGLE